MDVLWQTIYRKYPQLHKDDKFMSGCLLGIIQEDLSKFGCVSDELAVQVRVIAMVLVQSVCKTDRILRPPSSLHLASYYDCVEMLDIMLKVFDYEEAMSFNRATPAQFAAVRGHLRALVVLHRNVNSSIYSRFGGFSAYDLLKSFSKHGRSDQLPSISRVFVCGDNSHTSLGIMHGNDSTYPVPVQFFDDNGLGKEVKQVSFGKHHAIYLINGQAYSCGLGRYGKLGHGDERDQLKLRAIKFGEPIVCVSAGLTHSIICTRKKIVAFGLNHMGQIGLGTKEYVSSPTVAKIFKEKREYIISCSTANSRSVIMTNNFDFYVAGEAHSCLWQGYSSNTFRIIKNSCSERTTSAFATDSCIVHIYSTHDLSKVTIKVRDKNHYVTSTAHITGCIGVFYNPKLSVLFSGYKCCYENHRQVNRPGIFLYNSQQCGLLQSVHFYNDIMDKSIVKIASVHIARNGRIIIVDYLGDVYEGNIETCSMCMDQNYAKAYKAPVPWIIDYAIKINVSRLFGILPAKNAFLTPDGKNKILTLFDVDPRPIIRNENNVSKVEYPSHYTAAIICKGREGAVKRYEASLEMLKYESAVLSAYFERWSEEKKEIRITAEPEIVKTFLDYCYKHYLRSDFSVQELMELLIFADKLICQNFFKAVMKEIFKPPFEISQFRDFFGLAHHLSSVELYKNLNELCAAIFPTLLENGFINELSFDEIVYIEDAFRSYALENLVCTADKYESEIRKLVVPYQTVRNIIKDVMTVVKEPVSIKVLIDLCKDIRTYSKECGETISSESVVSGTVNDSRGWQEASPTNEKNSSPTNRKNDNATNLGNENGCDQTSNILTEIAVATNQVYEKNPEPKNIGVGSISFNEETDLSHVPEEGTPEQDCCVCSHVYDLDMEEQAMAELTAHYEDEDTMQDVPVTACAERKVEEGNDLL